MNPISSILDHALAHELPPERVDEQLETWLASVLAAQPETASKSQLWALTSSAQKAKRHYRTRVAKLERKRAYRAAAEQERERARVETVIDSGSTPEEIQIALVRRGKPSAAISAAQALLARQPTEFNELPALFAMPVADAAAALDLDQALAAAAAAPVDTTVENLHEIARQRLHELSIDPQTPDTERARAAEAWRASLAALDRAPGGGSQAARSIFIVRGRQLDVPFGGTRVAFRPSAPAA